MKAFSFTVYYRKAPKILQVVWKPPSCHWVKCNMDGVAKCALGPVGCGVFSEIIYRAVFWVISLSIWDFFFAVHVELTGVMLAIETALGRGWFKFWIECDFIFVLKTFKSFNVVHY